jgi:hypothetical protein
MHRHLHCRTGGKVDPTAQPRQHSRRFLALPPTDSSDQQYVSGWQIHMSVSSPLLILTGRLRNKLCHISGSRVSQPSGPDSSKYVPKRQATSRSLSELTLTPSRQISGTGV